jgi:hypothetical protein
MYASLTISPPDFLNSSSGSLPDVGSTFRHFGYSLFFTAFTTEYIWLYDIFLSQYALPTNDFISCRCFRALASMVTKKMPPS